jgi:hypothetical protein
MCKEELNQVDEIEEVESQEQEYFTQDEVYDIIEQVTPKVEINVDEVQGLELNSQEFQAGIDSISFLCGQYSALRSVGIDSSSAIDIIVNERNIEFNLQINQMTCTSNEKTAKIQQTIQEQNQV